MKVLIITGDKNFERSERFTLQAAHVEALKVVYWGPGSMWPAIPQEYFDVVTVQDPFWRGAFAWHVARSLGSKLNVQVHTSFTAQSFIKRVVGAFVLRHASSVRVVSYKIKESLAPLKLKSTITVLPIFVDIEAVRSAPPIDIKTQYPQFDKIILVASRLEAEKDVAETIESLPEVLASHPKTGLLIAGNGSQRGELEALASNLGVAKSVIFLGYVTDVFSLYKSADVLFNPSWYEGYGASMVEALAAGCPVVAADVGVAKEAGATVVSRDDFAKALVEVLHANTRASLKLHVLTKEEWAREWKRSL